MSPLQYAIQDMESAAQHYRQDLEAMTEEQILGSAGGGARKPVDFTFEVALINRRIAARMRSVEPPAAPEGDEWWVAPEDLRSKQAIGDYMIDACGEIVDAAKSLTDENVMVGPAGKEKPAYSLLGFAAMHTMYHCAQLNFIQSLTGDLQLHWQ